MVKANDFGCGLTHEFAIAAAKTGWTPGDLSRLIENEDLLASVLGIFKKTYEIKPIEYIISARTPFDVPSGWTIAKHEPVDVKLSVAFPPILKNIKDVNFTDFESLQYAYSAIMFDYLFQNEKNHFLIPKSWMKKVGKEFPIIVFAGTIFHLDKDKEKQGVIRTVQFDGFRWKAECDYLTSFFAKHSKYFIPFGFPQK